MEKQNVGFGEVELPKLFPNVHAIELVFGVLFVNVTQSGWQPEVAVAATIVTIGNGFTITVTVSEDDGVPQPSVAVTV